MKTYPAYSISNYFFHKARDEGRALTPMQMNKLVYIAHGWHLAYFDQPLIDETVQGWKTGPIIAKLYRQLKKWGDGGILEPLNIWGYEPQKVKADKFAFLDAVWKSYCVYSGLQLATMARQAKYSAWLEAWQDKREEVGDYALPRYVPVEDWRIKKQFDLMLKNQLTAAA